METLAVEPGERILEVGCGSGAAEALVCERLVDGRLPAIDRSAVQVERARQRNRAHLDSRVLELASEPRLLLVYETPTSARAEQARERLTAVLAAERFSPPDVLTVSPTLFCCVTRPG